MKKAHQAPPPPLNGVDTPNLFATIGHVAGQPELAKFRFTAESQWVQGTHSRSTMTRFFGAPLCTATPTGRSVPDFAIPEIA